MDGECITSFADIDQERGRTGIVTKPVSIMLALCMFVGVLCMSQINFFVRRSKAEGFETANPLPPIAFERESKSKQIRIVAERESVERSTERLVKTMVAA
ncbi:hypothetical protein RB195_011038 [Necator americanus]|uniref:Uncharacterized protein n=1 Tax=Necator americanus TaxID=51031 RepID=A0ABR1D0L4_NECAM